MITIATFLFVTTVAFMAAHRRISTIVRDCTVPAPLSPCAFPVVDMNKDKMTVVMDRAMMFVERLYTRTTTNNRDLDDLIITQDEINGLISHSDFLRGRAYVRLGKGSLYEEHCLPADKLPGGSGRYFVGDGYIKMQGNDRMEVMMETATSTHHKWFDGPVLFAQLQYLLKENGSTEMNLTRGSIFGYKAPQGFINRFINQRMNSEGNQDIRVVLDGIEYVRIQPGKIVIHPRKCTRRQPISNEDLHCSRASPNLQQFNVVN